MLDIFERKAPGQSLPGHYLDSLVGQVIQIPEMSCFSDFYTRENDTCHFLVTDVSGANCRTVVSLHSGQVFSLKNNFIFEEDIKGTIATFMSAQAGIGEVVVIKGL